METIFLALIISAIATTLFIFFAARHYHQKFLLASLRQTLFLIRLPENRRQVNDNHQDFKEEISASARLFTLLASFKKTFTLEAAVPHVGEEIHFFVSVSDSIADAVKRQIHAIWPDADISPVPDFNIFHENGVAKGVIVKQRYHYSLPLKTFDEVGGDTFAPILSGLSKINDIGEGAAIQVVVSPLSGHEEKNQINSRLELLKKGSPPESIFSNSSALTFRDLKSALSPTDSSKKDNNNSPSIDEELVSAISKKSAATLFAVNIRFLSSAPSSLQADSILDGISAGLSELSTPKRNEFKIVRPKNQNNLIYNFSFRRFSDSEKMILNGNELASLFHFPSSTTNTPRVKWLKARESSPPATIPKEGVMIGETNYRQERLPVFLSDEDRRRHLYLIGQTGTGKSTLMKNMALSDIRQGKGVSLIDPHGELVNDIASLVPENRVDDVIIFDPADFTMPIGLNMLDYNPSHPEEKTFVVNEMQSIFNRLFSQETMGPMFEQYMRNTLLLLMEDYKHEPPTLIEVPRVLTDASYRSQKLSRISNPSVVDFWTKEATKAGGEAALANMAPYITSKFNNFIANDYVRPIIGQPKSAINFRTVMDERKILLVNLSKGKIGDINAGLLGMIITGKLLMAALSRVDIPESERRDFYLYIDEFQNFTTDSISTILSEARKYRLNLTIAHQYIAQLSDEIRNSVFGNVGSMVSFRVGVSDAEHLEKHMAPVFDQNDLINIENLNAYTRLLFNGEPAKPFNIKILLSDYGNPDRAALVRELSRNAYGRPRAEVETDIFSRLRS